MAIHSVGNVTGPIASPASRLAVETPNKPTGEFSNLFKGIVESANQEQLKADNSIQQFINGESNDIQSVAMTMAKADLSFRLVLEIRNKLMDAYQEVMRMQV